jgi:hypothetical protein
MGVIESPMVHALLHSLEIELSINQYHANHVTIINLLSDLNVARYYIMDNTFINIQYIHHLYACACFGVYASSMVQFNCLLSIPR